jgi:hypothetical protein
MDDNNCRYALNCANQHAEAGIKLLTIFTVIALVAVLSLFSNPHLAYADDGTFCQLGTGGPCKEVFAVGSGNQPLTQIVKGPGISYIQSVLRAYVFTGTEGQESDTYMLFRMTVTLNPDFNNLLGQWLIPSTFGNPDSSPDGNRGTMQARLWSINTRGNCATGTTCVQRDYPGLELNNYCNPNGGSQSFGVQGIATGQGSNVSWGISSPTYIWCTLSPSSDIYSHYYDFTLQDGTQANTQITEDFVFAQWQQSSNHVFKIGYSVTSHLGQLVRSTRIEIAGPSITNQFATYQV